MKRPASRLRSQSIRRARRSSSSGPAHAFKDILALSAAGPTPFPGFRSPASVRPPRLPSRVKRLKSRRTIGAVFFPASTRVSRANTWFCRRISTFLDVGVGQPMERRHSIFNGAMDNASGIATLLETAAAINEGKRTFKPRFTRLPRRNSGGERAARIPATTLRIQRWLPAEDGRQPEHGHVPASGPASQCDRPGSRRNRTSLMTCASRRRAARAEVEFSDPEPERNAFVRSDRYSFIKRGCTGAVVLKVGFAKDSPEHALVKRWRTKRYHAPSDDLNQPCGSEGGGRLQSPVCARYHRGCRQPARAAQMERRQLFRRFAQP